MATFKFGRAIDIHWQGYEIVGPANTVFSIPDQLYEEFNEDIFPVEPTLEWIDTNEFLTLTNAVSVTTLTGTSPIVVTATSAGKAISLSASYQTAGTYITAVNGTAPIAASTNSAGISTVSITASYSTSTHDHSGVYQAAGTYVTSVAGTAPISTSTTTAGAATVSVSTGTTSATVAVGSHLHSGVYQDAGTYVTAVNGTAPITASTSTAGIVTVGLSANYQTAGTYVTAVNGSAPIATSTDTAGIVSVSLSASYASSVHTHSTSSITSGNFAATVSGGTGVTVTGGTGNASTPTVAIGQAVATTSDVTFAQITGTGVFSAPNISFGYVTVAPVANDFTGVLVIGLTIAAPSSDASIAVTGNTGANAFRTASASGITFSGGNVTQFTVNVFRTNTTNTGVWWMVMAR
jgi:hypothetical protein